MNEKKPMEINCPACGQSSLLKRVPRYDGFTRVGETLSCADCGHVFAKEADVPFKRKKVIAGFDARQLPSNPRLFAEDEASRICRYCESYVVNPFVQRCARWQKEVAATDTCDEFIPKPERAQPLN